MAKDNEKSLLKKGEKWGAIVGACWIALNIIVPLALLRIPAIQAYLAALKNKLPFDIQGLG